MCASRGAGISLYIANPPPNNAKDKTQLRQQGRATRISSSAGARSRCTAPLVAQRMPKKGGGGGSSGSKASPDASAGTPAQKDVRNPDRIRTSGADAKRETALRKLAHANCQLLVIYPAVACGLSGFLKTISCDNRQGIARRLQPSRNIHRQSAVAPAIDGGLPTDCLWFIAFLQVQGAVIGNSTELRAVGLVDEQPGTTVNV